jgi:steroid delta-isomerase-like uncharacterized protein
MTKTFSAEAWYTAISSHEVGQVLAFASPQIRYEDVPTSTVSEGPDAVKAFFERVWAAIPDMQMVPTTVLTTGSALAVEWIATGTHSGDFPGLPATGNPFHIRGISMIELVGGQVQRVSDYWDLAGSGLLSPPSQEMSEQDG